MTISATYAPDTYAGNDVLDTFAITFAFLSVSTNVKVSIKVDSTGVITEKAAASHYNIVGSNVVFTAGNIPATGETVLLELSPDFKQSSDYTENGSLPAETLEADLDERTLEGQINNDLINRAFRADSTVDISSATMAVELPASGTEILTVTVAGLGSSTAAALGVLTTPISVANGGMGASSHTADAILTGAGASAIVSEANITAPSGILTVGNGATSAGQVNFLEDSDNGSNTCSLIGPASTANVTVTLPAATDTLTGKATTDTLTNKTINTASNTITVVSADVSDLASSTVTWTNKTMDANATGNSITNIDVADLANGTDGELITWDSSAAPAVVAAGTANQVLTSNGPGAAPTFQSGGTAGVVDFQQSTTATSASTSTQIPLDTSIPQNTEGAELLTVTITPSNSSNILVIEGLIPVADVSANGHAASVIFQDTTADALQASDTFITAGAIQQLYVKHIMAAGTTSATTFKLRYGMNAVGTIYVLQDSASNDIWSTSCIASLTVTEYTV